MEAEDKIAEALYWLSCAVLVHGGMTAQEAAYTMAQVQEWAREAAFVVATTGSGHDPSEGGKNAKRL